MKGQLYRLPHTRNDSFYGRGYYRVILCFLFHPYIQEWVEKAK